MFPLTTEPLSLRVSMNGAGPTDLDLLRGLRWSGGPKRLVAAAGRGDPAAFAREARRELARRFGREAADAAGLAARFPLHEAEARAVYARFTESAPGGQSKHHGPSFLQTAVLLDGLRRFGGSLDPTALWPLWRAAWLAATAVTNAPEPEAPLDRLLAAEILTARGVVFDDVADVRPRMKAARKRLLIEFEARTDTDGTPHAELLPVLPAWFASLARAVSWARVADARLWGAGYSRRFDGLLRTVATLACPEGRLLLTCEGDVRPILREAVKRSGWKAGSPVRRLIAKFPDSDGPDDVPSQESVPRKPDRKSPPVAQSDWAKLVASRARWRPHADAYAVSHDRPLPSIGFLAFGHPVFAGEWGLTVRLDGRELELTADWEAVCWFSDRDADYVELQWPNEQGITLCRQLLLTRGDHQLVVADAVSTPGHPETRIEVDSRLPLAAGVTLKGRPPSRELRLDAAGLPLRAFPLALPGERIESAPGSFDADGRHLLQRRTGLGGVYLPAVFDWHPRRREAYADWRTLTVTEEGRRLGPGDASGHRLRIGRRQLLLCRSLTGSKLKRTVLGYHHGNESILCRFTPEGDFEPLVLVE